MLEKKICLTFNISLSSAFVLGFLHLNWFLIGEVTVAVISSKRKKQKFC